MNRFSFIFIVFAFAHVGFSNICGQDDLQKLCHKYPERIEKLFSALDLDYKGLEKVKAAREKKDRSTACCELLKYYESSDAGKWLRKNSVTPTEAIDVQAEQILRDTFVFQGIKGTVPRNSDGKLDWNYSPNDDFQWTLFLNRHFFLSSLMNAYFKTGNLKYVNRINDDFRDWIISSPYDGVGIPYHDPEITKGIWQWTLLEAGSRAEIWPGVFYGLYDQLAPDVKILILSSVPDHLHALRYFHAKGGNHLALELRGLASMAAAFQEFKDSGPVLDYCAKVMSDSLIEQVYPDGVQKELTVHYHGVAFRAFDSFAQIYQNIGRTLPTEFKQRIDLMLDYMAYVQRPNGYGPLNNDSDYTYIRKNVIAANETCNRSDWSYINSNGKQGSEPDKLSVFYPWAGQVIMRNGWDEKAQWAFFDIGPWGTGHRHADKLHLSITAYGCDLLVDSGRYTYVGYSGGPEYPWRDYFITSISHNVILIDGKGQAPKARAFGRPLTNAFVTTPEYDFARGEYNEGYVDIDDKITHTRAVLYLRDRMWVVADRINSQKPHQIQALWRWHPDCNVELQDRSATSIDKGRPNLRIIPVSSFDWNVELVKGQEKPFIQGWYSIEYNKKTPNHVVVYTAYNQTPQTFVWVIQVDPEKAPEMIDAKILSDSPSGVRLSIKSTDTKTMTIDIPMTDSVKNVSVREE